MDIADSGCPPSLALTTVVVTMYSIPVSFTLQSNRHPVTPYLQQQQNRQRATGLESKITAQLTVLIPYSWTLLLDERADAEDCGAQHFFTYLYSLPSRCRRCANGWMRLCIAHGRCLFFFLFHLKKIK
jgi:hypothetical protein